MSEICYACGKEIEERIPPHEVAKNLAINRPIGKYTVRRAAWDENWKEITEDIFFHEACYFNGFVSAIRYGLAVKEWEESGKGDVDEVLK